VALSADGKVLAIGAPMDNGAGSGSGAVWIFKYDTAWTQDGNKLIVNGAGAGFNAGYSVALSAYGDILVVGVPSDSDGSIRIFINKNNSWVEHQKLFIDVGYSVAISANGNTIVSNGRRDTSTQSAHIFTRDGEFWKPYSYELDGFIPSSVTMSPSGNTMIFSDVEYGTDSGTGRVWVYS
jgi:hypothetical protein